MADPLQTLPVELRDVRLVAPRAERVIAAFELDLHTILGVAEVHHIGATSLPFGHTKGDVDVNVRVAAGGFSGLVRELQRRLVIAQPENWTPSFASFSAPGYELPLGVQVTAIGSPDDFLLDLRELMRSQPDVLARYDAVKVAGGPNGAEAYWHAKNALLTQLVAGLRRDGRSEADAR